MLVGGIVTFAICTILYFILNNREKRKELYEKEMEIIYKNLKLNDNSKIDDLIKIYNDKEKKKINKEKKHKLDIQQRAVRAGDNLLRAINAADLRKPSRQRDASVFRQT